MAIVVMIILGIVSLISGWYPVIIYTGY
jgi:hypothetical protein